MNRTADSFTRTLVAALLAATSLGQVAHAASGYRSTAPTEEVAEPDQLSLAREAVARGDNAEALSRYVRVLAARPRDLDALVGAGNAAVDLGDFSAGLAFFGRAEEVDPHNGRVKAGLASALAQTEQPGAALKLFDEAVTLGVPEAEIAGDRGLAWDLRGNPRRAQRDYAMALANKPNDHEVTLRLALSQAISGDRDTAMRTLEPWLRKQDQGAWRTRAFILAMTGDTKGASQAATAVLPAAQANAMAPFFARLASLNPAQKALAANFGYLPGDKPAAVERALPASSAIAAANGNTGAVAAGRETTRIAAATRPTPPMPAVAPVVPAKPAVVRPAPVVVAAVAKPGEGGPVPDVPSRRIAVASATIVPVSKPSPIEDLASANSVTKTGLPPLAPRPTEIAAATPAAAHEPLLARTTAPTSAPAVMPATPKPLPVAPAPQAITQPPVATPSAPDVAAIRAQTAADAEAEARAERERAEKAAALPPPEPNMVEAHVSPPMPAPAGSSRPIEAGTEIALNEPARPVVPAKPVEPHGSTPVTRAVSEPVPRPRAAPGFALDEPVPVKKPSVEPGFALDDHMAPTSSKAGESHAVVPAHVAKPSPADKAAAAGSPPRMVRIVGLPLSADVARSFAAMPHGSALSVDIVVEKTASAPKAAKKVELAADDLAAAKMRKPAAAKIAMADADDDDAKPAKSGDHDSKAAKDADKLSSRDSKGSGSGDKPGKTALADKDEKAKPAETESASKAKSAASASVTKGKKALADGDAEGKAGSADSGSRSKTALADDADKPKARSSDSGAKAKSTASEESAKAQPESEGGAAKGAGERYWVQVAGGANKGDLDKAWNKLKGGPAGSVLAGHTPSTTPLKTTNRLLVGPFADTAEAQSFVNKLAGAGTSAFLFKSAPGQKVDRLHGP